MTVYISRDDSDNSLTHYGVKGMKWKHHKAGLLDEAGDFARRYFSTQGATPTSPYQPSNLPSQRTSGNSIAKGLFSAARSIYRSTSAEVRSKGYAIFNIVKNYRLRRR